MQPVNDHHTPTVYFMLRHPVPCFAPVGAVFLQQLQVATADRRRELLSHSLLKSYQTQAAAQGAGDLTVGLLVPHVSASADGLLSGHSTLRQLHDGSSIVQG